MRACVRACVPLLQTCSSTADECVDDDGNTDIQSFGSIEAIFDAEAETTTRYMLTGRRCSGVATRRLSSGVAVGVRVRS